MKRITVENIRKELDLMGSKSKTLDLQSAALLSKKQRIEAQLQQIVTKKKKLQYRAQELQKRVH